MLRLNFCTQQFFYLFDQLAYRNCFILKLAAFQLDLTVLHNHFEILAWVGDEVEVLQWIAVDQDKISVGAFLPGASVALHASGEHPESYKSSEIKFHTSISTNQDKTID
jgi:hypothetical protein